MTKMATKPTYGKNLKADCAMLEMSWITAILQLYSKLTDLFGKFAKEKYFNGHSDTRSVQENFNLITSFIQDSADKHIPS